MMYDAPTDNGGWCYDSDDCYDDCHAKRRWYLLDDTDWLLMIVMILN